VKGFEQDKEILEEFMSSQKHKRQLQNNPPPPREDKQKQLNSSRAAGMEGTQRTLLSDALQRTQDVPAAQSSRNETQKAVAKPSTSYQVQKMFNVEEIG